MTTADLIRAMFPALPNPDSFAAPLDKVCARFEINSKLRLAASLAQAGHESAGLRVLKENLNYSVAGLLGVFGRYFSPVTAPAFARQPAKIANRVYANRMGNGSEASGDGYAYCGRGAIQLTGKDNYIRFAKDMGLTLEEAVAYLETVEGALMSAGWFWSVNGLNALADKADMVGMTRRINGGTNGLDDRMALYAKAKGILRA